MECVDVCVLINNYINREWRDNFIRDYVNVCGVIRAHILALQFWNFRFCWKSNHINFERPHPTTTLWQSNAKYTSWNGPDYVNPSVWHEKLAATYHWKFNSNVGVVGNVDFFKLYTFWDPTQAFMNLVTAFSMTIQSKRANCQIHNIKWTKSFTCW